MSIPKSFSVDIVGNEVLKLEAMDVIVVLRVEKMTLFIIFPMGTIMQDGGKRKRSDEK